MDRRAPVTRFEAEWSLIRSLVHNGHFDVAERQLATFTPFVIGLDSRHAAWMLAELHGSIARQRGHGRLPPTGTQR